MEPGPIECFLEQFLEIARSTAEAWCGDPGALLKLFKGSTEYSLRYKDWFPTDGLSVPRRRISRLDYDALKNCLVARGQQGEHPLSSSSLSSLDAAYDAYAAAMLAHDARRNRALTGRSMHLKAAVDRIERLTRKAGHDIRDLRDRECFKKFFAAEVLGPRHQGKLHETTRVARALCTIFEKDHVLVDSDRSNISTLFTWTAAHGLHSSRHARDLNAQGEFLRYLRNLQKEFGDLVCSMSLRGDEMYKGTCEESAVYWLKAIESGAPSKVFEVWPTPVQTFLPDAADFALRRGANLLERVQLLGDRTPQNCFKEHAEVCQDPEQVAIGQGMYARWLCNSGRLEEAWDVIANADANLKASAVPLPYVSLTIKENQAHLQRSEWELNPVNSTRLKYQAILDETANYAFELRLNRRAEYLLSLRPN